MRSLLIALRFLSVIVILLGPIMFLAQTLEWSSNPNFKFFVTLGPVVIILLGVVLLLATLAIEDFLRKESKTRMVMGYLIEYLIEYRKMLLFVVFGSAVFLFVMASIANSASIRFLTGTMMIFILAYVVLDSNRKDK